MIDMLAKAGPEPARSDEQGVKPRYLEALHLVERLHRGLLNVVKDEFERRGRDDVNAVQALLLYNIGDKELTAPSSGPGATTSAPTCPTTSRSVEAGYLHHARSRVDRRSVRLSLTEKGDEVHEIVKGSTTSTPTIEPIGDQQRRLRQAQTSR
jgi:hypothetical protein